MTKFTINNAWETHLHVHVYIAKVHVSALIYSTEYEY